MENSHPDVTPIQALQESPSPQPYEPPSVERVLRTDDLERAMMFAGPGITLDGALPPGGD